jgi:hypothetical protein
MQIIDISEIAIKITKWSTLMFMSIKLQMYVLNRKKINKIYSKSNRDFYRISVFLNVFTQIHVISCYE